MNKNLKEEQVGLLEPPVKDSVVKETLSLDNAVPADNAPVDEIQFEVPSKDEVPEVTPDEVKAPEAPATGMRKHPLNIAPEATPEQYALVRESILQRKFNNSFPIVVAWDGTMTGDSKNYHLIVDGWTRWQVCQELDIQPVYKHFDGTAGQILDYVINSNSRKIYTSDQWACFCTLYKIANADILSAAAKERIIEGGKKGRENRGVPKSTQLKKHRTNDDVIKLTGADTNKNKITETDKLKEENPERFNEVYNNKKTLKEIRTEKEKAAAEKERIQKEREASGSPKVPKLTVSADADALYKTPIKDFTKMIRKARKEVAKLEEEQLAPATKALDDYNEASKANRDDKTDGEIVDERYRFEKIEDKIQEKIDIIKLGLTDDLFETI